MESGKQLSIKLKQVWRKFYSENDIGTKDYNFYLEI